MQPDIRAERATIAPAKVNLCLHVTGQRASDGYHTLESLVVFADARAADRVAVSAADKDGFSISGRYGEILGAEEPAANLVIRARDWLRAAAAHAGHTAGPVHISLEKSLPIASGIGGGSADAAGTLRLLTDHWGLPADLLDGRHDAICQDLGADVAMCIESRALIARGIGESLSAIDGLPALPALLVNPGDAVATPDVFARLTCRANAPMPEPPNDAFASVDALAAWLEAHTRNDLQVSALGIVPAIANVLHRLDAAGAACARMSGSGATCFGLFGTPQDAQDAAQAISSAEPGWWVQPTVLNPDPQETKCHDRAQA